MLVIGLTGGISTGKSTVSTLLSSSYSIPIIDADILARSVLAPGTPALKRLTHPSLFGPSILLTDGSGGLDRKKLGEIIFNDPEKRKVLNSVVHPAVRWGMFKAVIGAWIRGERAVVLDVPLLIEGGVWKWVGTVVVVYCSPEIQLDRLIERDCSTSDSALSRISSQMPITDKVAYADYVIDNSGSQSDLSTNVEVFVRKFNLDGKRGGSIMYLVSWLVPPMGIFSAILCLFWKSIGRRRKGIRPNVNRNTKRD